MFEKILSEIQKLILQNEEGANACYPSAMARESAYYECKEIVQEVAKEYEEKKYYRIVLSCLEDSTSLEMPLTEQEYLFLTRLSDLVYRVATGCMPTMYVEQKGE